MTRSAVSPSTSVWTALSSTLFLCLVLAHTLPSIAHAGVYKCISAEGDISYSQQPCAENERLDKVLSNSRSVSRSVSNPATNDCSITRKFALQTAGQMHAGQTSAELFKQYGGLGATPKASVALINYVYTYKQNYRTTPERIAELVNTRCEAGAFGSLGCSAFPQSFIADLGGCSYTSDTPLATLPGTPAAATAAVAQVPNSTDQIYNCQKRVLSELDVVRANMKERQSAESYEALLAQHNSLRADFNNC